MITRKEAVAMSEEKWIPLAKGVRPESNVCGFCLYAKETLNLDFEEGNESCQFCPLYPDICADDLSQESVIPLYWKWKGIELRQENPLIYGNQNASLAR